MSVDVRCTGDRTRGWRCSVVVDDPRGSSEHDVTVTAAELARFDPDADSPEGLVERSFAFLLEREPPSSILRSFGLSAIARYFPDYPTEIARRARA